MNPNELEITCSYCHGDGRVLDTPDYSSSHFYTKCYLCNGYGKIPSEFGEKLLKFIYKHVKLEIKGNG